MEKPNIAEGEWEVLTDGMWHLDDECYIGTREEDGGTIVIESLEYKTPTDKAEAQAISAVPEMIDALIEARQYIKTKVNIFKEQYPEDEPHNANNKLKSINDALRKAGVQL